MQAASGDEMRSGRERGPRRRGNGRIEGEGEKAVVAIGRVVGEVR